MSDPRKNHEQGIMRTIRYLKTTKDDKLDLNAGKSDQLEVYVDASWGAERGSGRRSRSGIAIFYGTALIYYKSTLQKCVALSSSEAEYVAMSEAGRIAIWLRSVLNELGVKQGPTTVYQDNPGSASWATGDSSRAFAKRRHIDISYHFILDHIKRGDLLIRRIPAALMKADLLTKVLGPGNLKEAKERVGLH